MKAAKASIVVGMACHFITLRRVEFCDTDLAGIVHFANYYRYMEQAEHSLFRYLGLKIHGVLDSGWKYGWPRVSSTCNYQAPAFYGDVLEIRLTILRRSPRSLAVNYAFWREGASIATGEMTTAFCVFPPGERMRSEAMPDFIAGPLDAAASWTEPVRDSGV